MGCQTVCVVLKVYPSGDSWHCSLVNLYVLGITSEQKTFDVQVIELKRLIQKFNPREVVIDINGIGQPFGDDMVKETWDDEHSVMLPAYGFQNYDDLFTHQPKNCQKILYGIKANAQLNSEMHSDLYSKVYSGCIDFLISEQDAQLKLNSTRKGSRLRQSKKMPDYCRMN